MSEVQSWDPASHVLGPVQRELLNRISSELGDDSLSLSPSEVRILQSLFLIPPAAWTSFAVDKSDDELVDWIRVWTLCPEQCPGFADGARSPVISLVRVLRRRGVYSTSLHTWIKEHTTNRFLPHGSLADRLG